MIPRAVEVTDVTSDGRPDLVVTSGTDSALYVFAQARGGWLAAPRRYETNSPSSASGFAGQLGVAAGDLTGDAQVDVAVATPRGVAVFAQIRGVLWGPSYVARTRGAQQVAIADLNRDGAGDLVVLTRVDGVWPQVGEVLALTNTGSGFTRTVVWRGVFQHEIEVGDLSSDGRLDIAAFEDGFPADGVATRAHVFWQRRDGTFEETLYEGGDLYPASIEVADVTGDRRLDLALGEGWNNAAALRVFPQKPDGTLASAQVYTLWDEPDALEAADVDRNALQDLVAYGDGNPSFPSGLTFLMQYSTASLTWDFVAPGLPPINHVPVKGFDVGDLNGDGKPEVVLADAANFGLVVLRQPGADTTPPETTIVSAPSGEVDDPTSATISFAAGEAGVSFQCALDLQWTWTYCTSPKAYNDLSWEEHWFGVRAVDAAGNVDPSPATTSWRPPPPPGNDKFSNSWNSESTTARFEGANVNASKESGEPEHAGNAGGHSVWFGYISLASGRITVETSGSTFDTLLAVYTGNTVSSLTPVASNDDCCGGSQSKVTFAASANEVYRIAVDGRDGATGGVVLSWKPADNGLARPKPNAIAPR